MRNIKRQCKFYLQYKALLSEKKHHIGSKICVPSEHGVFALVFEEKVKQVRGQIVFQKDPYDFQQKPKELCPE